MKYFKKGNFIIVKDASDQEKNSFNLATINRVEIDDLQKKIKFGDGELNFINFISFTLEDGTNKLKADFPNFSDLKTWALSNFFFVAKSNGGGGGGSVSDVSITSNNGITSSITDNSTTPKITLGLGNITPTSVNSTGSITGSNLSGTNTGDETKSSIETKLGVAIVNVIDEEGDLSAQVPTVQAFDDAITPVITNLEQQIDLKLSQDYLTNQFKGEIDISTNPNYPAGKKGDVYLATSTAPLPYNLTGKIGGANGKDLQINNVILCVKDTSGGNETTAGKDWKVLHDYPAFEYDDGSVGATGLLTGFFFQKLLYVTSLDIIYDDKNLTSNTIIGGTGTITYPKSYLFKIRYSRITIYNKFTDDATIIMPNMTESVATSFSRDEDIFLLTNQTTSEKPVNIVTQNFQLDLNTGLYTTNPVPFKRQDGSIVSFLSIDPNVSSTIRWSHTQQRFEEQ